MKLTLKDNDLKQFIEKLNKPKGIDELIKWEKDNTKAMKLIVDSVRNHLLLTISKLDTAHKMLKTLEEMFEIKNTTRIITLKDNLSNIKMKIGEFVASYLMRITKLRNQFSKIGQINDEKNQQ